MSYRIKYAPQAVRDLNKLPEKIATACIAPASPQPAQMPETNMV
jgi:mRNA-degrading endonuclease RelE of RelBE toxin-antitoxin system